MADARLTAPLVIAAGAIWPPVCTIAVCLRFYTRHVQNNRLLADDWLLIPALILLIGMCASALRGVALHSVGYPTPKPASAYAEAHYASYQQQTTRKVICFKLLEVSGDYAINSGQQVLWSIELMQIPALGLIKLSFMFFYKRIFAKGKGAAFKATINGFVGLIIIWIIGFFFGYLFVCKAHPSHYWTSLYNQKLYCNNSTQLHLGYAISDFIFDFLIIAFPIPLVWSLHMSPGRKIGVTGIFALGILHQANESTTSHAEILSSTNPHNIEMEPLPQRNQIKVEKTFTAAEELAEHGLYHGHA
ncbi:hypothetical protein OEA41_001905 [Lepraria neglecta]|uniref:Rhodopsin domain-containing protein n=1 Tax=Lepraria neglecta TaxID=209136 RepID=A0AAE0DLS3_9LECA|nr:hypothetical protein OEA41_001905 [Lepraria neglecta]